MFTSERRWEPPLQPRGTIGIRLRTASAPDEEETRPALGRGGILDDEPLEPCAEQFPVFSTSRIVAGGPISGEVFKCELQSIQTAQRAGTYGDIRFNPDQIAALHDIFPTGVCDYRLGDALEP